jgi:hypothetical protein
MKEIELPEALETQVDELASQGMFLGAPKD